MHSRREKNQGEGNTEAAERFNAAETSFVESPRGKRAIRKGAQVRPEEEAELQDAERRAHERAKEDPEQDAEDNEL